MVTGSKEPVMSAKDIEAVRREVDILRRRDQLTQCLAADNLKSRPTGPQLEILKAICSPTRFRFVCGGNQCLAEGTQILTPLGIRNIEDVKVGDTVYSEHGLPIKVLKVYSNGPKEVVAMHHRKNVWIEATAEHIFRTYNSSKFKIRDLKVKEFVRDTQVVRVRVKAPLGSVHVAEAYALGAMLGDGCCTCSSTIISSEHELIPNKVGAVLGASSVHKSPAKNYNWTLRGVIKSARYHKWLSKKKAHEKFVDLEDVKTWDRESVLNLLAGLIDTDGAVFVDSWGSIVIQLGMQAKTAIDFFQWALLTLWQVPVTVKQESSKHKYVNGNLWVAKVANNLDSKIILEELGKYTVLPRKQWKSEYENLIAERTTNNVGIKLGSTRIVNTYDITVDSGTNLYLLANGCITHNSGKTSILIRDLVWLLEDTHPFFERPGSTRCNSKLCLSEDIYSTGYESVPVYHCRQCGNIWRDWGIEPVNIILCGENRTNLSQNLFENRIKPLLLDPDAWKPAKMGYQILWLQHKDGRRLFLFPHGQGANEARKALQGWSIHGVYMDELAPQKVISELIERRAARLGYFMTAFTMKEIDPEVIRYMRETGISGAGKQWKISKLDNPVYAGDRDRVLAELAGLTEDQRNTILYGDISDDGDERVFASYSDQIKVDKIPSSYSSSWRHVELVDPAIKSKAGYLLMAQDPSTRFWNVIKAKYISGMQDAMDLVHACERESQGVNLILRGADNMAYFTGAARKMGIRYVTPPNKQSKTGGKIALIKKAQTFLNGGRFKASTQFVELWDEIYGYRWKEGGSSQLVNEHKYHILDCILYFIDLLPRDEIEIVSTQMTWVEEIRRYNNALAAKNSRSSSRNVLQRRTGKSIVKSVTGKEADRFYNSLGIGRK